MPLQSNASMADVINKLSELGGIDQKSELASVIGAPATANDNIATQITKLQASKDAFAAKLDIPNDTPIQAMVELLFAGRNWASGSTFITKTASNNRFMLEVSGLSFKPSIVISFAAEQRYYALAKDGKLFTEENGKGFYIRHYHETAMYNNIITYVNSQETNFTPNGFSMVALEYQSNNPQIRDVTSQTIKWFALE